MKYINALSFEQKCLSFVICICVSLSHIT